MFGTIDNPLQAYPIDIINLIDEGAIWPGDLCLIDGKGDSLRWIIERVQRRLLVDLGHAKTMGRRTARLYRKHVLKYAKYTHARVVLNPSRYGEMYRPVARSECWAYIPSGTTLLFRRNYGVDAPSQSDMIADACEMDMAKKVGYGTRELFYYWFWSLGFKKLFLGRKFMCLFIEKRADVCSGRYIHWLHHAELMLNEKPEAWYPARLSQDSSSFQTVACLRIA